MIEVLPYVDRLGRRPFRQWFSHLEENARARVAKSMERLEAGNYSALKGLRSGLFELRLHFGPGYRVYCGRDGELLVILLGGGTKAKQEADIDAARMLWREYKARKKESLQR